MLIKIGKQNKMIQYDTLTHKVQAEQQAQSEPSLQKNWAANQQEAANTGDTGSTGIGSPAFWFNQYGYCKAVNLHKW